MSLASFAATRELAVPADVLNDFLAVCAESAFVPVEQDVGELVAIKRAGDQLERGGRGFVAGCHAHRFPSGPI